MGDRRIDNLLTVVTCVTPSGRKGREMQTRHMTVRSNKHGEFKVLMDIADIVQYGQLKWSALRKPDGRVYFARKIRLPDRSRAAVYLHRLVMSAPAGMEVDHIHHNYLDLRKSQLRVVT